MGLSGTEVQKGAALPVRWGAGRVAAWDSQVPCLPQGLLHGINRVYATASIWESKLQKDHAPSGSASWPAAVGGQ